MHQIGADLKAIVKRFEKMTGHGSSVTHNRNSVTSMARAQAKSGPQDALTTEIYRLVRLLHNMDVNVDEIAQTINKRKLKTFAGTASGNAGDVQAVLDDIQRKYGHINPLFSIRNDPCES